VALLVFIVSMISAFRDITIESWNTQGLGCLKKRPVVRDSISSANPSIICVQETKLAAVDRFVLSSFLPSNLSCFETVDAIGSSGGILTAWDAGLYSLVSAHRCRFSLTLMLQSFLSDLVFAVTNVYAPANHALSPDFLDEFESLGPLFPIPWLIIGDFNLLRDPSDKNNANFDVSLASSFNDTIRKLALFELLLSDRLYTWSNKCDTPVLARLDRALFNHAWNLALPNSSLSSLPRPTSDHFPLMVTASTSIPRTRCFRFENAWLKDPLFLQTTLPAWHSPAARADAAGDLAARLKSFRSAAKVWKRSHRFNPKFENNCVFLIDLLDLFEETRPLSSDELRHRVSCRTTLERLVLARAAYWKQRGKFHAIVEGDENSKFFHARASQRLRRNIIRVLDVAGVTVATHEAKAVALHSFYLNLLGCQQPDF
jgi:exonuclease III